MKKAKEYFDAIRQLCAAGLHLIPIPPDNGNPSKAPRAKGWNKPRSVNNPSGYSANADDFKDCSGFNIGLYHGASQTLALDLDDVELAHKVFGELAGNQLLDWLNDPGRVEIKSPKANRGKLLFKLPSTLEESIGLRQLKHGNKVIFEIRLGNCQDVIFGQHPEGGDYQWIGNPAAILPAPELLVDMLQHWNDWKPCFDSVLGIETAPAKIQPHKTRQGENLPGRRNPIAEFNQAESVAAVLLAHHYQALGRGRFIRPGSASKAPGAVILRDCADGIERVFSHGADVLNDGFAHDAFDCYRLLACGGDYTQALNWNTEITKHNRRLFMQEKARSGQCKTQAAALVADRPGHAN